MKNNFIIYLCFSKIHSACKEFKVYFYQESVLRSTLSCLSESFRMKCWNLNEGNKWEFHWNIAGIWKYIISTFTELDWKISKLHEKLQTWHRFLTIPWLILSFRNNSSFHTENILWRHSLPAVCTGRWNLVLFHHGSKHWYISATVENDHYFFMEITQVVFNNYFCVSLTASVNNYMCRAFIY